MKLLLKLENVSPNLGLISQIKVDQPTNSRITHLIVLGHPHTHEKDICSLEYSWFLT